MIPHSLPPLTLLEEFILLAINDDNGLLYPLSRSTFDCALAGAVLMDLSLRHRIDNDLTTLYVSDTHPTDDSLLDSVLKTMALAPVLIPKPMTHWIKILSEEAEALRERALARLEERDIIKREDRTILWAFGLRKYPPGHDQGQREVKQRILSAIFSHDIPESHDMMLTSLADSCGLFSHILSQSDLVKAGPRIAQLAKMDLIGQAIARAIREIETAIGMASGLR